MVTALQGLLWHRISKGLNNCFNIIIHEGDARADFHKFLTKINLQVKIGIEGSLWRNKFNKPHSLLATERRDVNIMVVGILHVSRALQFSKLAASLRSLICFKLPTFFLILFSLTAC